MSNVSSLIGSLQSNNAQAITAYLRWNIVNARATLLSQPIRDEHFRFHFFIYSNLIDNKIVRFYNYILNGQKEPKEAWRLCVEQADQSLGDLLGKYFIDVAFPGSSKNIALGLLDNIVAAMKHDLLSINWMDPLTNSRALEKLSIFPSLFELYFFFLFLYPLK